MEDMNKILEQLFDFGYATRKIDLFNGKLEAEVRSLSTGGQLEIEKEMSEEEDLKRSPAAYVIHRYSLKLLSRTLVTYGAKTFENEVKTEEFLKSLSNTIVDKLVKEQNKLEKDIRIALKLENIEKNFSEPGPSQEKSEQLQK